MAEARAAVGDVRKRYARDTAIADALFVPMVLADLAGKLMVHTYEAGTETAEAAQPITLAIGDGQDVTAFLGKPWLEALAEFRRRGLIHEDELETLISDYADRTKEARKLLLEQIQTRVYELLDQAIAQDLTFRDFAKQIREEAPGLGITNQDPAYLQNVFRTNVLDAYGRGRHQALSDPDVVEARPYRQIRTVGDARVGDDHAPLDGLVYRADGPLRNLHTPFRYQCRCSIVSLDAWDGPVVDELPPGSVMPGFGGV